MGRPLPARAAGYRLYGRFKPYLCRSRPGTVAGSRQPKCGKRLPLATLQSEVLRALTPRSGIPKQNWLSAVEKWYNHAAGFYPMKGATGAFVHSSGKRAKGSPLRNHLRTCLRGEYPLFVTQVVKLLEGAYRLKPLNSSEYADRILTPDQRKTATSRAVAGIESALATWLFDKDNWVYLCSNKTGVTRRFFVEPTAPERSRWPANSKDWIKGDHTYLARVAAKLAVCRKAVLKNLNDLKQYQNLLGVGMFAGDKAAVLLRHASTQAVLFDKKDWQGLLTHTKHDALLKGTLLPVPQLWETPVDKVPKLI